VPGAKQTTVTQTTRKEKTGAKHGQADYHRLYNAIKEVSFATGEVFFVDIGLLMGAILLNGIKPIILPQS